MATYEILSPSQRRQFNDFSAAEMGERDLIRYYTFSPEDLAVINQHRRAHNRLGFAVQWCYMRYPGRTLRSDETVASPLLNFVAAQLQCEPSVIQPYIEGRDTTKREHQRELQQKYGYISFS